MAQLMICKYCGKDAMDSQWHRKCREAKLEDLLYRIKAQLEKDYGTVIPKVLSDEILAETFRSKEETEREYKSVEQQRFEKKCWNAAYAEAMMKFIVEWRISHPDPDPNLPTTY